MVPPGVRAGGGAAEVVRVGPPPVSLRVPLLQHVRAGQQHVRAGQQHVRAGQQHVRAGQQHVRAGQQHVRAGQLSLEWVVASTSGLWRAFLEEALMASHPGFACRGGGLGLATTLLRREGRDYGTLIG